MRRATILTALVLCMSGVVFGAETPAVPDGKRPGPPPEAYRACEGKTAGAASQFVGPHGNTISGACTQVGDKLVLRPDHPKGGQGGPGHTPPPGAYKACEGKKDGDTASFVNPKGMSVSGTCVQIGDKLALRPARPQNAPHD